MEWWRQLHPSGADLKRNPKNQYEKQQKLDEEEGERGKKHTENCGFAGIVEAENEDSSFLVTENGGKQSGKH